MQEFNHKPAARRFGKHPLLLALIVVLLVGSVGFAASGGIGMIHDWFVKVYIDGEEVDSQVTDYYQDEDGTEHMTLDLGEAGEAQLEMVTEGDQKKTLTVNMSAGASAGSSGEVKTIGLELTNEEPESDQE